MLGSVPHVLVMLGLGTLTGLLLLGRDSPRLKHLSLLGDVLLGLLSSPLLLRMLLSTLLSSPLLGGIDLLVWGLSSMELGLGLGLLLSRMPGSKLLIVDLGD